MTKGLEAKRDVIKSLYQHSEHSLFWATRYRFRYRYIFSKEEEISKEVWFFRIFGWLERYTKCCKFVNGWLVGFWADNDVSEFISILYIGLNDK